MEKGNTLHVCLFQFVKVLKHVISSENETFLELFVAVLQDPSVSPNKPRDVVRFGVLSPPDSLKA